MVKFQQVSHQRLQPPNHVLRITCTFGTSGRVNDADLLDAHLSSTIGISRCEYDVRRMTNDCIALGWAHAGGHEREIQIHARFMHALFQVVSEGLGLGTVVQGPWQF